MSRRELTRLANQIIADANDIKQIAAERPDGPGRPDEPEVEPPIARPPTRPPTVKPPIVEPPTRPPTRPPVARPPIARPPGTRPKPEPPIVEPPVRPRPIPTPLPTPELNIEGSMTLRDGTVLETAGLPDWTPSVDKQGVESRSKWGPLMLVCHVEQWEGVDATRVTVSLVNGFKNTGAVEFTLLTLSVDGRQVFKLEGKHAIQVRGVLARRFWLGRESAKLRAWEMVEPVPGYPEWVRDAAMEGRSRDSAYGVACGPYRLADAQVKGDGSLNGSHGGWLIGPHNFGDDGWQRGAREGYVWAEERAFRVLDRTPLALFDEETLQPVNPHVPYWPGRTVQHEPQGWQPEPGDGWCEYLLELVKYRPHDYTHGQREASVFAMLAEHDAWAEWVLTEILWHDYSCHLDGAEDPNPLLWPAAQIVAETPEHEGSHLAGRGMAHMLRRFLWAEPYLESRGLSARESDGVPWRDVLAELVRHLARPNGVLHAAAAEWGVPEPTARAREVDLLGSCFDRLDCTELIEPWRDTMASTPSPGSVGETFESDQAHWARGKYASGGTPMKANYFRPYDAIREDFAFTAPLTFEEAIEEPFCFGFSSASETFLDLVHPDLYLATPRA